MPSRCRAAAVAAVLALAAAGRAQDDAAPVGRLREIVVHTADVFDAAAARDSVVQRLINGLHVTTRREVILRECWLHPGDPVSADQAAELERNLRRLGLFAEVEVRLVDVGDGRVDLDVSTRDRLSIFFGGGGSYVGGVSGFNAAIGESNLFGNGDRVDLGFRRDSEGDYRGSLSYRDLHLGDSWLTGTVRLQRTDDGDGAQLEVIRPFKHLQDPRAWSATALFDESAATYYLRGDTAAEVPVRAGRIAGDLRWAAGPEHARDTRGVTASFGQRSYDPATGPLAASIRVPGDTADLRLGGLLQWDRVHDYRKVAGIDTLEYVQDLTLGTRVRLDGGLRLRDEDGRAIEPQPEASVGAAWAGEPLSHLFVHLGASVAGRWYAGTAQGWSGSARAQAFWSDAERRTLALSATYDAVEEFEDLPPQLTLGEDTGLRGYRAREFTGTRRLRINLEPRWDTGVGFWTFRFGVVAFADVGWVGAGSDLGRPYRAAGAGLRVGSKPLLGSGVVRIDVARPFDEVPGESRDWSVSISVGQVFTFGGNTSGL
ncbi:MAG: hypothetical protein AB7O97_01025 [Planctomycetota bacterium]